MSSSSRRGRSLVEVLLALAVVAFALCPVLTMARSAENRASFGEYRVLAEVRALRLLHRYRILPFSRLAALAAQGGGTIAIDLAQGPVPPSYESRLARYEESLVFEEVPPASGLARLTATITWSVPVDGGATGRGHRIVLSCLVADATRGLRWRKELHP